MNMTGANEKWTARKIDDTTYIQALPLGPDFELQVEIRHDGHNEIGSAVARLYARKLESYVMTKLVLDSAAVKSIPNAGRAAYARGKAINAARHWYKAVHAGMRSMRMPLAKAEP